MMAEGGRNLKDESYMEQPKGYVKRGSEGMVCILKKCIVWIKTSIIAWNIYSITPIWEYELESSEAEHCIYHKGQDLKIGDHTCG